MTKDAAQTMADSADILPRLTAVPGGIPDIDASMQEAAAEAAAAGKVLRIRLPLLVFSYTVSNYRAWEAARWTLELTNAEEATAFREGLDEFIRGWVAGRRALK